MCMQVSPSMQQPAMLVCLSVMPACIQKSTVAFEWLQTPHASGAVSCAHICRQDKSCNSTSLNFPDSLILTTLCYCAREHAIAFLQVS